MMKEFRYEDVQEGQAAFNVYCNIYRNGELIIGASPCIPEHVIMDEGDPALEEKLISIAEDYVMKNISVRIAEHMLTDVVIDGKIESHDTLVFEYREPMYQAKMVEEYEDFRVVLVHPYEWCKLTDEERDRRENEMIDVLEGPYDEELPDDVARKIRIREILREMGGRCLSDGEEDYDITEFDKQ